MLQEPLQMLYSTSKSKQDLKMKNQKREKIEDQYTGMLRPFQIIQAGSIDI